MDDLLFLTAEQFRSVRFYPARKILTVVHQSSATIDTLRAIICSGALDRELKPSMFVTKG
jgi:hypothetical protein